jgi:multiple antibiotic resistance protein
MKLILIGVISLVCLLTYIILFSSTRISNFLGETGNNVLMRLMGLILMVIAVEFFLSGVRPILTEWYQSVH